LQVEKGLSGKEDVNLRERQEVNVRRELDSLVTQMHSSGMRYEDAVREFKKQYLREVLVAHRGNQCKAAEELGMHRNTLSRAMAELGLRLAEVRASLKRPPRSERPVFSTVRPIYRRG
jgi:DNA-binding NtrC family response regulator